jgi:hypothetical protein
MSVVRLGSHKAQVRGHGIHAREEEEPPTIKKKTIFHWRHQRRGVTSLEDAPQGGKTRNGGGKTRQREWSHLKG